MFYPLEPNGAILTPIYTSNSGASTRTRLARPDICHDGRHMMAGYRLGSCCVSLRCLACLPSIMLRVLVLHDALQLLLLPLPLLHQTNTCLRTCLTVTATFWLKLVPFRPLPARPVRCVVRLGLVRALRVGRARGAPFTA